MARAWVGQRGGATPYIDIAWHGGLTRWQPLGTLSSRAELVALLVGPLVGATVGGAALLGSRSLATLCW